VVKLASPVKEEGFIDLCATENRKKRTSDNRDAKRGSGKKEG